MRYSLRMARKLLATAWLDTTNSDFTPVGQSTLKKSGQALEGEASFGRRSVCLQVSFVEGVSHDDQLMPKAKVLQMESIILNQSPSS
jgi:hypothetical protein